MNKKGFLPLIVLMPIIIILLMIIALLFLKIAVKILIYIFIVICLLVGIRWLLKSEKNNPAKQIANSCKARFTDEEDIKKCERGEL